MPFTRRCLVAHTSPVEGDGNGNNTPKPPPPDGGNGNNTPWWWNYISLGFGGVSALVVALGVGWTFFRDGLLVNYLNVQQVMKAIKVSKLQMPQVAGYIYIKRNQEMKAFKKMLYDPEYLQTIIVTGPRGSGKSTLVRHCLAGKGGVVRVCLNTRSEGTSLVPQSTLMMKQYSLQESDCIICL